MPLYFWCFLVSLTFSAFAEDPADFFYSSSGQFTKTANTNCLVWNSYPKEGETVTWTGPVVDGKADGKGLLQWFTNGVPTTRYEGEMKGGYAHGHGVSKSDLFTFEGDWAKGKVVSKTVTVTNSAVKKQRQKIERGHSSGKGSSSSRMGTPIKVK